MATIASINIIRCWSSTARTGQLITAVLRPGTVHASHGVVGILKRIVGRCGSAGQR